MFGTGVKCPACGTKNSGSARFCSECGSPLAGATCPACNAAVPAQARFCPKCGTAVSGGGAPGESIAENRWSRPPDVFATRLDSGDFSSIDGRRLLIEPGCKALLFQSGKYMGVVPPGRYEPKSLLRRWLPTFSALFKPDSPTTAVLIEDGDIGVELGFDNLRTQDYHHATASVSLLFSIADPEAFMTHLLRGRNQVTRADLSDWLGGEIRSIVAGALGVRPARELTPDADLRTEVEENLRLEMNQALKRWGLELTRLRFVQFSCPEFEKTRVKGAELDIKAEEIKLGDREVSLDEERQKKVTERIRELESRDFIHRFQSGKDLEDYVTQVEHESGLKGLLRKEEMAAAVHDFGKNELSRQMGFERLKTELKYENLRLEAKLRGEVDYEEFERRERIERMKLENDLSNAKIRYIAERERQMQAEADARGTRLADAKTQAEIDQIELEKKRAKMDLGLLGLERVKEIKRRDEREHVMLELESEDRRAKRAMDERRAAVENEKDLLGARSQATHEALLASAGGAEGQRLADVLTKREQLKAQAQMSPDQLMALAMAQSPDAARAMAEKFKSEGASSDQQAALLREMLDRQDAQRREEADRIERISAGAMGHLGAAAQAGAARPDARPVAFAPGAWPIPQTPGGPGAGRKVFVCPKCNAENEPDSKFCSFCSQRLTAPS